GPGNLAVGPGFQLGRRDVAPVNVAGYGVIDDRPAREVLPMALHAGHPHLNQMLAARGVALRGVHGNKRKRVDVIAVHGHLHRGPPEDADHHHHDRAEHHADPLQERSHTHPLVRTDSPDRIRAFYTMLRDASRAVFPPGFWRRMSQDAQPAHASADLRWLAPGVLDLRAAGPGRRTGRRLERG